MDAPSPRDVTTRLHAREENQRALDQLAPPVYKKLHRLAHHYMASERFHEA